MRVSAIGSKEIAAWATELGKSVQPQTVGGYVSSLAAVFKVAQPMWGYPLDRTAMTAAS